MAGRLEIFVLDERCGQYKKTVERIGKKIIIYLKKDKSVVRVYLVSGKLMRSINKRFLGKDRDTNILSFEEKGSPDFFDFGKLTKDREKMAGEIYLSPGYIARHKEDINHLLVHGILHLFGYDHKAKGDTIKMENLEKRIKKALNL